MNSKFFWVKHYLVILNFVKLIRLKYKFVIFKPDFLPIIFAPIFVRSNSFFYSKKIHLGLLKSLLKYQVNRDIILESSSIKLIRSEISKFSKNLNNISKSQWKYLSRCCACIDTTGNIILGILVRWLKEDSKIGFKSSEIWKIILICSSTYHNQGLSRSAYKIELEGKKLADLAANRQKGHYQETSYFSSIGHLSMLDFLIKGKILGEFKTENTNLIYVTERVANEKIALLLKAEVTKSNIKITDMETTPVNSEGDIDLVIDKYGKYKLSKNYYSKIQRKWDKEFTNPILNLDSELENRGKELFNQICIPSDVWFVGLHLRNSIDFNRSNRNSNLKQYKLAIETINKKGGMVVRIGTDSVFPNFKFSKFNAKEYLFDLRKIFLTKEEREILHCYVWAKSKFFIGNLSGGTHPSSLFGIPTLWTDVHPITSFRSPYLNDIMLPKKIYNQNLRKFMSLSDMLNEKNEYSQSENLFVTLDNNFYVESNNEFEIRDAVKDMIDLVDFGKVKIKISEKKLTNKLFKQIGFDSGAYIAPSFINKFPGFLSGAA